MHRPLAIIALSIVPLLALLGIHYAFCRGSGGRNRKEATSPSMTGATQQRGEQIRVSCVGDSITHSGCSSATNTSYPAVLQKLLGSKYNVTNYGNSGMTMLKAGLCGNGGDPVPKCGGDCSYWDQDTYWEAMHGSPDIVAIMLGTNDAKYCNWYGEPNGSPSGQGVEFRSAYLDMISSFKSLPSHPLVYVVVPPPLTHPPGQPDRPPPFNMSSRVINSVFPRLLDNIAMEGWADGLIDIWSALGGKYMDPALTCDGCHPMEEGLGIIAETIARYVTRQVGGGTTPVLPE